MDDSSKEPSSKDAAVDDGNDNINISTSSPHYSTEIENAIIQNTTSSPSSSSSNLVREGIIAGKRIAKISVVTLLAIGVVEIVAGYLSGSVVATADGIDSISDAMISFIVLLGLLIAHRPPDKKFHFGYHKVEFCCFNGCNRNDCNRNCYLL